MAQINIITTVEEQQQVLEAIAHFKNQTVAVSAIAKQAKMNQNRVRYVITDLIDAGKLERIATKAYNPRYIRYKYYIVPQRSE